MLGVCLSLYLGLCPSPALADRILECARPRMPFQDTSTYLGSQLDRLQNITLNSGTQTMVRAYERGGLSDMRDVIRRASMSGENAVLSILNDCASEI